MYQFDERKEKINFDDNVDKSPSVINANLPLIFVRRFDAHLFLRNERFLLQLRRNYGGWLIVVLQNIEKCENEFFHFNASFSNRPGQNPLTQTIISQLINAIMGYSGM